MCCTEISVVLSETPRYRQRIHRFQQSTDLHPADSAALERKPLVGKTVIWILLRASYVFFLFVWFLVLLLFKRWYFPKLPIEPGLIHCEGLWRIDRCSRKSSRNNTHTHSQTTVAMVSEYSLHRCLNTQKVHLLGADVSYCVCFYFPKIPDQSTNNAAVWHKLSQASLRGEKHTNSKLFLYRSPGYFQYLTLIILVTGFLHQQQRAFTEISSGGRGV